MKWFTMGCFAAMMVGCASEGGRYSDYPSGVDDSVQSESEIAPVLYEAEVGNFFFRPVAYEVTSEIGAYNADDGYVFAVVYLEVDNLSHEDECINWWAWDQLEYHGTDDNRYNQYILEYMSGHLDSCFNPEQSISGWVAFEVAADLNIAEGVLALDIDDQTAMVHLEGLPRL